MAQASSVQISLSQGTVSLLRAPPMGNGCCGVADDEVADESAVVAFKTNVTLAMAHHEEFSGICCAGIDRGVSIPQATRKFEVTLDRSSGRPLGIDVDYTMSVDGYIPITSLEEGLATDWNKTCSPGNVIKSTDVIVGVNGVTKVDPMLEKLMHAKRLQLTLASMA
uniref:Uncharacterized protein n=1 Tax=Zooxanthella nutricula TaxID=1333877 RepID=A0A7S2VMS7_9DINO